MAEMGNFWDYTGAKPATPPSYGAQYTRPMGLADATALKPGYGAQFDVAAKNIVNGPRPAPPPLEVPPWLEKSARWGKGALKLGAAPIAAAVGGGVGAGIEAVNTTNLATSSDPENRIERARRMLLGGANVASFGAAGALDRWANNRPAEVEANPMLGPQGQAAAAGGAVPRALPPPEGAQMVQAFGPDFKPTYPMANVNEGVGAVRAEQPGVVTKTPGTFNVVDKSAFTGLDPATSAALSQARQSAAARGDFGAVADSYRANGGTWMGKTAAQAQKEEALADTLRGIRKSKTVAQQKNYMDLYGHMVTADATTAQHSAELGVKQEEVRRKSAHDWAQLALDATTKTAAAKENLAKAGVSETAQRLAAEYLKANPGDFIGAGHALHGTSPTVGRFGVPVGAMPDTKTGAFPMADLQHGTMTNVVPQQTTSRAQAIASAKKNGKYVSDEQVVRDIKNMPNFKLTD